MKKILFATAMFVFSFQTIAFCQTDGEALKPVLAKLGSLLTDHIVEKAYLHFDRPYPYYVAGEVVYFKAYVTMGERHEPSTISSLLHVDLIDKNDAVMQSITLQLTSGTGWGDFSLPENLQKGSYRIRAYTEWMRNDSNPYFFDQYISVSTTNSVDRITDNTAQADRASLQFFPEGGTLVSDVRSKVAFKALGTTGLGINVKGVVIDNENKEVAKIASGARGMGVIDFIPETGMTYKAKVTFGDGTQSTVNLPVADAKGIALVVNTDDPAKVSIEVRANRAYYKENMNKALSLVIYWGGAIRTVNTKLDNQVLGIDLPTSTFRTGILQVTLFSGTGEPMNERLAFIQTNDLLNLTLNTNKPLFTKREGVKLSLSAKNKDGNAVNGSFSVSVIDESKILVDENAENSILSYLLLTSDLKGYIEKPNYYFANVTKDTRADLDALMLTQGYRRFAWKELLRNSTTATTHTPEKSVNISGTLKTKAGAPIVNCKVDLLSTAGGPTVSGVTDAEGKFSFPAVFETGMSFIIKTQSSEGKKAVLTLDTPPAGPMITPGNSFDSKYNANADILASLQSNQRNGVVTASNGSGRTAVLLNREGVTTRKSSDNYRSSNIGGAGHADQVISGDAIKDAPTLSSGLNGLARGVQFISGVASLINGKTISAGSQSQENMLLVVDGAEIGQGANIDQYNPGSIETVEILKGPNAAIYGIEGGQGVIVLTSRQGGQKTEVLSKEMSPGIFSIQPKGFYKAREFYAPAYNGQPASSLPDTRTTIFWKPDVNTDADGNATLNFFNADGTGNYRVVVEGMDTKGNLGRQVFRYKVE